MIEHIIWEKNPDTSKGKLIGLCVVEVFYHGGDREEVTAFGSYEEVNSSGTFRVPILGTISSATSGVSDIALQQIGYIQ